MLKTLSLINFRNHDHFTCDLPESGIIFVGPNGVGKTSILEAIFSLATTRPFRTRETGVFLKDKENTGGIFAQTNEEKFELQWQLNPRKTILKRNDVSLNAPEFLEKKTFFAVLFSPEDLQLPFSAPAERRKYLNRVLFPLGPKLYRSYQRFEKILKQRNALLRRINEGKSNRDELEFYDEEFAKESVVITEERRKFLKNILEEVSENYKNISGKDEEIEIRFFPSVKIAGGLAPMSDEETVVETMGESPSLENTLITRQASLLDEIKKTLKKNLEHDIFRGSTNSGAHKDDFCFFLRGEEIQNTGSRGEVRSAVLALKMAERKFIEDMSHKKPILLLDDVFSELDSERRKHLASFLKGQQVIITATDTPERALVGSDLKVMELRF